MQSPVNVTVFAAAHASTEKTGGMLMREITLK